MITHKVKDYGIYVSRLKNNNLKTFKTFFLSAFLAFFNSTLSMEDKQRLGKNISEEKCEHF